MNRETDVDTGLMTIEEAQMIEKEMTRKIIILQENNQQS